VSEFDFSRRDSSKIQDSVDENVKLTNNCSCVIDFNVVALFTCCLSLWYLVM